MLVQRLPEARLTVSSNSVERKMAQPLQLARRTLIETEKSQSETATARKVAEDRLQAAENKLRDLDGKLEEEGRESSDAVIARKRLAEELEDEREQHQKDLAERDFATDQTRKKYQAELAQLSEGNIHNLEQTAFTNDTF